MGTIEMRVWLCKSATSPLLTRCVLKTLKAFTKVLYEDYLMEHHNYKNLNQKFTKPPIISSRFGKPKV